MRHKRLGDLGDILQIDDKGRIFGREHSQYNINCIFLVLNNMKKTKLSLNY